MNVCKVLSSSCLVIASISVYADGVAILPNSYVPQGLQYYGSPAPAGAFFIPDNAATSSGPRVAVGDVSGDGVDDIVVAPASGAAKVFMYSGAGFATKQSFFIAGSIVNPSVAVAPSQPGRDARVVIGYGPTNAPIVNVFNGTTGVAMSSFYAFDPSFTGGVNVAAGDVSGDGVADIVAGQATGGGIVRVFDGVDFSLLRTFTPYSAFSGGISVAAGDVNGDNVCEVVVAPASGAGAVRIIDPATLNDVSSFFAFANTFAGGVNVASSDHDRDGFDDVVMSVKTGGPPQVRVFSPKKNVNLANFFAFDPSNQGGCCVGGSNHPTPRTTIRIPTSAPYYRGPITGISADVVVANPAGVPVSTQQKNLSADGRIELSVDFRGNLKVRVKPKGCLSKVVNGVASGGIVVLQNVPLVPGDCNGDNYVGTDDYLILNNAFDTSIGEPGFDPRADLDGDGYVGTDDYQIFNNEFDSTGQTF